MELRHLRYFVAVAKERSFTRAANRLGVAQPPLSRQMRELEAEFGVALFDRDSRPINLTNAGRLLFDHAQRVLNTVEQLHGGMRRLVTKERRRFIVGFVGSTIYGPVPELISRFREAAPEVDIDLVEMNTVMQIAALKEGRIDAGLGRLTFEDPAVRRRVIERERLVAAFPRTHALASGSGSLHLADLTMETLIVYPSGPRPSYADQVLSIFRDSDLCPAVVREVRELQTALGLVAADFGVCVVPASVQRMRRDDIVFRPLIDDSAMSPIILSWRVADESPAMSALCDICARISSG